MDGGGETFVQRFHFVVESVDLGGELEVALFLLPQPVNCRFQLLCGGVEVVVVALVTQELLHFEHLIGIGGFRSTGDCRTYTTM